FQNGVSRLHSTRGLQTMSSFVCFSICENYCTLSSTLRTTGQLICIKRGETGYYPSDWDTGDKEGNVELADELNEDLGVTPIQRQAMEIGSMAGWDVPGADPKHYEESYSGQTSCANFEQKQ
ncbi:MAG: hypothetical protein E7G43_08475, partial [Flavonifractor plautii]|nr:hypothetical protein [Flavonifractor plautii]